MYELKLVPFKAKTKEDNAVKMRSAEQYWAE